MMEETMIAQNTKALTWEEFESIPDDGMRRELIEGQLIVVPPPKSGHNKIAKRVFALLLPMETQGAGFVYMEAGYKLSDSPPTWVEPDLSFLSAARDRATDADDYFRGAPELAVEVISPLESARDIERKVDLMLRAGALTVWVVFPETRHVRVYLPDGTSTRCTAGQVLTAEILPGFELPVERVFAD